MSSAAHFRLFVRIGPALRSRRARWNSRDSELQLVGSGQERDQDRRDGLYVIVFRSPDGADSGGSIATTWAMAYQPTYAPELNGSLIGFATGGMFRFTGCAR